MPHKRNPITTERITGLARVLRGYAQAAVENVALWHERDISHSGAERVDPARRDDPARLHAAPRDCASCAGMVVHADRMRANLELTRGALFSQRVLLALVAAGMQRDDAYRIVQRARPAGLGHAARRCATLLEPSAALGLDLDAIFDYAHYMRHVPEVLGAARGDPRLAPRC